MAPTLPDVTSLASLPEESLTAVLDLLFEPSAELHTITIPTLRAITFATYTELIDTIRDQLLVIANTVHPDPFARKPLLTILGSHPRLGAQKINSAQSAAEQAQLQTGVQEEAEKLAALNAEYEAKFPGLRYVVFVNGKGRDVIMQDMRRRIDRGDFAAEEKEAINVSPFFAGAHSCLLDPEPPLTTCQAMAEIAKDRAGKLDKESEESTVGRSALPEGS